MANNKRKRKPRSNDKFDMRDRRNDRKDSDRYEQRDTQKGAPNDVSWYTKYPNLSVASAQFPFPYRPGMSVNLGNPSKVMESKIPGVMELQWYPSIGWSENATDPASIVCKELFARVRRAYGAGDLLADAPDFMMYLMALDGIFSYIASLRRVFRILNAWTPDNYIIPDVLLNALGCSDTTIQNLRSNRNTLWQVINELTLMSRKFTCPAVMDIMNRHFWMNDNVYTDAMSINSQLYVFHQMGYYQYAAVAMPSGDEAAGLTIAATPLSYENASVTVEQLYTFGRNLIDALVAWDDAYTINGYLSRAFDGAPNFIVDETPIDQPFNPAYEPEVLMQIENSRTLWAGTLNMDSLTVSQDVLTNSVISKPTLKLYTETSDNSVTNVGKCGLWYLNAYLSQRSDNPTVADNIVASRLQSNVAAISGDTVNARIIAATEIPMSWTLWYGPKTRNGMPQVLAFPAITDATLNYNWLMNNQSIEAFDWHPFGMVFKFLSIGGKFDTVYLVGDTHNFTTMSNTDLANMHKICVYSEFNAFSVG